MHLLLCGMIHCWALNGSFFSPFQFNLVNWILYLPRHFCKVLKDKARPVMPRWHDLLVWLTTPIKSSSLQQEAVRGFIVPEVPLVRLETSSANMCNLGRTLYKRILAPCMRAAKLAYPSKNKVPLLTTCLRCSSGIQSPEPWISRKKLLQWSAVNFKVCRSKSWSTSFRVNSRGLEKNHFRSMFWTKYWTRTPMSCEPRKVDNQAQTKAVSKPFPLMELGKSLLFAMSSSLWVDHGLQAVVFLKAAQYSM